MQKSKLGRVAVFGSLKIMVTVSLLAAMSIVCGKYLAFGVGNVLRFSFENLPVLLAGMLFGPVIGAVTGIAADLIGCLMVGYAINPVITAGAAVIGAFGGAYRLLMSRASVRHGAACIITVATAHLIGSVVIKTVGLSAFYDMPLPMLMVWRLFNYVLVGTVEAVALYYVLKNKSVISMYGRIERKKDGLQ